MSTIELRNKLIDKIRKIEDVDLLNEVNRLIETETSNDEIYKFGAGEIMGITEAENEIKNGQFLTDEEAKEDINEWLKKYGRI
jgi:predicted transcriptional regulator